MSDDNFSGFIRSGKSHGVSVSEHTGNAKTVRNKVSSDEQEIEARKTAFEKQKFEDTANIQKASSGSVQAKEQFVSADASNANRQEINQGSVVTTNVKGVKTEVLKENNQKIDSSSAAVNLQKVGNANVTTNNQGIAKNKVIQDNDQKIPNGGISNNIKAVDGGVLKSNVQGIPVDGLVTNKQDLDPSSLESNNQSLPKDLIASDKQATKTVVNDKNLQPVLNGAPTTNDARTQKLVLGDNNQSLSEQAAETNRQTLKNLDPSLNMHRAPKEGAIGANLQPTDKENLDDHFEVLPSEKIKRAEDDLGRSVADSSSESKETFAKIKIKQQVSPLAAERTLAAQQAAKQKHDKYVEAFHGRLAGIKRGVDELNGRLDVMEMRK
jgi:hypothetical protein